MKHCFLFEILHMVSGCVFCEPIKLWINVKKILNLVIFFLVTDFSKIRLHTEPDWQIGKGVFCESD